MKTASNGNIRHRFKISPYTNPTTGSKSWRVAGYKLDGTRVRDNYADENAARCRQIELEAEAHGRQSETAIKATKLSDTQLRLAETAFINLDDDADILRAVDHWNRHGKAHAVAESPRIDEAVDKYLVWLAAGTFRDATKRHWRIRMNVFKNSVQNHRVADVTPEIIEAFLDTRKVSPAGKDSDRRAVSRFFSWCIERPRRWATTNPCALVRVDLGEATPPAVLSVDECEALLKAAQEHKDGALLPYVSVCLYGGLRPFEASRLTWNQVNLADGEIRLEGSQTKTKAPRVVTICPTLKRWLTACRGKLFFPANWRKDFDAVKEAAGFGPPTEDPEKPKLKRWVDDVMRHTSISHYFRQTGSYGQTAEQFGNSEAIIKKHYAARVSTSDAKAFYSLKP